MRVFLLAMMMMASAHSPRALAAPPETAVAEVNYLLQFIDRSGCRFFRNGSWYDAHRAQSHLREKYDFLAASDRIMSAEDFIEQAATRSSMTGVEYRIQCAAGPALPSNSWLHAALLDYRASNPLPVP